MTSGELEKIPLPFQKILSDLESRVMSEIVRAIKINGFSTATADWQMRRLVQMGKSEKEIKEWVQEALELSDAELEQIYSEDIYKQYYKYGRIYKASGKEQIPFEENKELQALIEAAKRQTKDTFRNMTASLGFAIRNPATGKIQHSPLMEFYQGTLTNAVMDIASGAISYDKALSHAINTMTNSGLRWIDYESGWHNRVDVAARRAVMTGFRQVQGKINEQVAEELGTDSYEVSCHIGARPEHQVWQGRVYTYKELETVCGLGTGPGLCGWNCYHNYAPFILGISVRSYTDEQLEQMAAEENKPKTYNGKQYTTYEALQEQRKMETAMRKTRQDIKLLKEGDASKDTITLKKARYQLQQQQYKAFSEAMKLPEQKARVYQDGLGKVAGKADKHVVKSAGFGIIEMTRKTNDSRKDFKFISDKTFDELTISAKKKGAIIIRGTKEAEEHLERLNAAASNVGDVLIFRKNVCISEVLEEVHHFEQNIEKLNADKGEPLRSILNEIEAKQYLLDNINKYKIPRKEVELTKAQLESYKKQLRNYRKAVDERE